jgi:hypothetical protein
VTTSKFLLGSSRVATAPGKATAGVTHCLRQGLRQGLRQEWEPIPDRCGELGGSRRRSALAAHILEPRPDSVAPETFH